jgi:hypothetical protein
MKTRFFYLLGMVLALCTGASAQIKVFSDGTIGMLGATSNGGYSSNTKGWAHQLADNNGGEFRYLRFQPTTLNPRISGTHDCVVFYSHEHSIHQDIQVKDIYQYSDREGKTNVIPLFNSLDKVKSLNPVSFGWKNDTASVLKKNSSGNIKQQFGFIAQDVEQALPDLVVLDEEGNKLVNYVAIIPVLVDALKELNGKVETLEKELADLKSGSSVLKSSGLTTGIVSVGDSKPVLYQNAPNPSSGKTRIKYSIPAASSSASIYVFDLSGSLMLKKDINGAGDGEVVIYANELKPGMYIYSLIINSRLIDTKRMILTK